MTPMILVYSEDVKLATELLAKATTLATTLGGSVTGATIDATDDTTKTLAEHGASTVFALATGQPHLKAEEAADALKSLITEQKPTLVLIGSTRTGKEIAARLAGLLDAGCIMDATSISAHGTTVTAERTVYSGNGIAVERFAKTPAIVTVPARSADPLPKTATAGKVEKKPYPVTPSPSKITSVQKATSEGVNVEDAEIIVSCGRGLKNKDDIRLVSDLASALKGKTVGCSRPIAADLKWLSEDHWIGLSGHKVKPKLYVACGISGQIQHIAGMRDSGIVVAINKDPEALIFKSADYGIVGDLYQVLPKLTEAIKAQQ